MKIQELAIIFVIIILPISLLLAEYTQFQIQTISLQTEYDTKLTTATYDAIKAYQLNSVNETYSDIANENLEGLEASVTSFRNSIMTAFELNGYTKDELDNYIPALVYTLYDGFYIYSPYVNNNYLDQNGNKIPNQPIDNNAEKIYGLKPYINYSCRYQAPNIDVVITYALDNYITVQGIINDEYVNKSGYLIEGVEVQKNEVTYNGVKIQNEHLKENVLDKNCSYAKVNGIKYYLIKDYYDGKTTRDVIATVSNGTVLIDNSKTQEIDRWEDFILNNDSAKQYYIQAHEFTKWFKSTDLVNLQYSNAIDEIINEDGFTDVINLWSGNTTKIFNFDTGLNIENETSEFNQHRLAIIRHKIETNLAIAISNYNEYSGAISNVFQMPELKEDEWEHITHNICLMSFLQGLPIGGKIYNGYTLVTNSESTEVVQEEYIYILGKNTLNNTYSYHKVSDKGFGDGSIAVDSGNYGKNHNSAGRLNLDFRRNTITKENVGTFYYYSLKDFNASYDSIIMQNNSITYDDIYQYVNNCGNDNLKQAFYTALGRERASKFNINTNGQVNNEPPYIPEGYNHVRGTSMDTGFVIKDGSGNEFVWVEVPRISKIYNTAGVNITQFEDDEYTKIENDLRSYSSEYGFGSTEMDEWTGYTGLSQEAYNIQKRKMLKSIYLYGGFYIGRYEAGTLTARTASTDTLTQAVIKQNVYPYNYVTVAQAQQLASGFSTEGYPTSLLFGVQWNLTMKYLETKGGVAKEELKTDSTAWGNFLASEYEITNENVKYSTDGGKNWTNATNLVKNSGDSIVLTTGASKKFSKQNIYDLGGNLYEWVLAKMGNYAIERGNYWGASDVKYSAGTLGQVSTNQAKEFRTFRVTLYKEEETVNTYTVTYNANGGDGAPLPEVVISGQYNIQNIIPTREGYEFAGWSDGITIYQPGEMINVSSDMILTAIWNPIKCIYTFDSNGGTYSTGELQSIVEADYGTTIIIPAQLLNPTREGYTFLGYSEDPNATSKNDNYDPGKSITVYTDKTLYAVWEDSRPIYTITFDINGGTGVVTTSLSGREGETVTLPTATPTKDGYKFCGWGVMPYLVTWYVPGKTITLTKNLNLKAMWMEETTNCTITFNLNGGTGTFNAITVPKGTEVTLPTTKPTKSGYIFGGWLYPTQNALFETIKQPGETFTVNEDITLNAKWTKSSGGGLVTM